MDLKKTNAPVNTITYNKSIIEEPTGNVYGKTRRVCHL